MDRWEIVELAVLVTLSVIGIMAIDAMARALAAMMAWLLVAVQ